MSALIYYLNRGLGAFKLIKAIGDIGGKKAEPGRRRRII